MSQLTPQQEAAYAVAHPEELTDGKAFRRMLANLLAAPIEFRTDFGAEDYLRANPYGVAHVVQRGVVVQIYHGVKTAPVAE